MYGPDEMKVDDRAKFNAWYDTVKDNNNWNFRDEFIKYCDADVQVLTEAVFKFRKNLVR